MSDSDDTDILLLIPPNYYLANAEENLIEEDLRKLQKSLQELDDLERQYIERSTCRLIVSRDLTREFEAMDLAVNNDGQLMPPPQPPSSLLTSHQRKVELNHINAKLHHLEREERRECAGDNASDISSISANTVRTQFGPPRADREIVGMVHSTPKCMNSSFRDLPAPQSNKRINNPAIQGYKDEGVLLEIDNFLLSDRPYSNVNYWENRHSDTDQLQRHHNRQSLESQENRTNHAAKSLPAAINTLPPERIIPSSSCYQNSKSDNKLISLSEIWGKDGQTIHAPSSQSSNLKEEQLRRYHLERTIQQLQSRLLEYQQKISVAIEVDRTKDNALTAAEQENKSLAQELQQLRSTFHESEIHQKRQEEKMDCLQKELSQAVGLATKFQEKNERLENELNSYSRKNNESCNQYKQQIEELEIKTHACKRSEELAINELQKLRDKYAKSEHLYEKAKLRCDELEKENSTLRHQKDMLQEFHQKQKTRADNLETQRKSLQESLGHLTENEAALKKKLELQQKTLKSHYQQQLENVVSQKLKEFQEQLDRTEEALRSEARERERLIAERAVKQLELINEKNELELNLLQEKHNEEVELYRIQLANASKKIDDLDIKLSLYKSKRADIAEKLHCVMETQWQKALEILTSPNQSRLTLLSSNESCDSTDTNETHNNAMLNNHNCDTPKTSKKENNLNLQNNNNNHKEQTDKLQAYIELLLSKSPSDFDKLDEILALSSKAKQINKDRLEKTAKRQCLLKKPWKS